MKNLAPSPGAFYQALAHNHGPVAIIKGVISVIYCKFWGHLA